MIGLPDGFLGWVFIGARRGLQENPKLPPLFQWLGSKEKDITSLQKVQQSLIAYLVGLKYN
jgi:hypothetical protein